MCFFRRCGCFCGGLGWFGVVSDVLGWFGVFWGDSMDREMWGAVISGYMNLAFGFFLHQYSRVSHFIFPRG